MSRKNFIEERSFLRLTSVFAFEVYSTEAYGIVICRTRFYTGSLLQ